MHGARKLILRLSVAIALACSLNWAEISTAHPVTDSGSASSTVLKNATIHTMTGKGSFVGTIVIESGKIVAVGEKVDVPENAKSIDLIGCHIVPGLIESRSNLWLTPAATTEVNSKATLNVVDAIDPWNEDWRELAAQGITTVYVQPASASFLGGYGAVLRVGPQTSPDKIVLKDKVAIQASIGTKGSTSKDRHAQIQSLQKLFESAKEKKKKDDKEASKSKVDSKKESEKDEKVADKDKKEKDEKESGDKKKPDSGDKEKAKDADKKEKPETDPTKLALRRVLNKEIPLHVEVHHSDSLRQILALAKKLEIRLVLDGLSQIHSSSEEIADAGFPLVVGPFFESTNPPVYRKDAKFDWLNEATESGQLWAISNFGTRGRYSRLIRVQAATAIASGIKHESALAAVTINPARMLGVADQIGTIEKGKSADIAVFQGDPLDPSTATRLVMSQGNITFERDVKTTKASANDKKPSEKTESADKLPSKLPASFAIKTTRLLKNGEFTEGFLVIRDGKVVSASNRQTTRKIPMFDLKDQVVTPGLVVANSNLGQTAGISDPTESDASHLRAVDGVDPTNKTATKALAGGFVHIGLAPGTANTSAGSVGHLRLGSIDYVAQPVVAGQYVLTSSARNAERYPSSLNGQVQMLNDLFRGELIASSVYVSEAIGQSIANAKIESAKAVASGNRPAIIAANTKLEIRSALTLAKTHKLKPVLLTSGRVGEFAQQLAEQKFGLIVPQLNGDEYDSVIAQFVTAEKAGVRLAFAGETPEKIRLTAALLVNAGLSPKSALTALTNGGASVVGMKKTGFAKGAPADFVVWTDSPLNLAAKPINVVVDGQPVSDK